MSNAHAQSLARLEALARLLDSAIVIPGTRFRFGADAVVGLFPVVGDIISGLFSTYIIVQARRLGAPNWLLLRMAANTFMDTAVGAVPLAGDVFDVMFRANLKNLALLRRHLERAGAV
jgi:hypothetical protein